MGKFGFFLMIVILFLTACFSLNLYFYQRLTKSFDKNKKRVRVIFIAIFIFTILALVTQRVFSFHNSILNSFANYIVYYYMTYLFIFLFISESLRLIFLVMRRLKIFVIKNEVKKIFITSFVTALIICVYGIFEAGNISIKEIVISTSKLEKGETIKIAQISDVHFSPMIGPGMATKIKLAVEKISPDIFISTGDLVDRNICRKKEVVKILKSIKAPMGKFAVTGNHEFYAGLSDSIKFTEDSGFRLIRNGSIRVKDNLLIVGIDDKTVYRFEGIKKIDEKKIFAKAKRDDFVIFLRHQPRLNKNSSKLFDLQLSGHTHGGQIFPFIAFVKIVFRYTSGLYELENNNKIYVSNGTGTWGPVMRFLSPPEISLIILKGE